MRKLGAIVLFVLACAAVTFTQVQHIPVKATLPNDCRVGDIVIKTGTNSGFYTCVTTNTWTGPFVSATPTDDGLLVGNGSLFQVKTVTDCDDTGGNHLNYDTATNAFSCGTTTLAGGGDFSSNTATSVDSEIVLFSGTGGKTGKRATTTGILKGASGVLSAATAGTDYMSPSSSETKTNLTLDAEGTGNVLTIPFTYTYVVAICQNATATLGLSTPTSNPAVAACVTGSNTQFGVAQFTDAGSTLSMQGHFTLPSDWTGNIDVKGRWRTSATSGSVVWQVATICVADAETSDPSFNTASTVTDAAKGTTLQQNDFSISSVTVTGCAAGEELYFKVLRDPADGSDSLAATAELISLVFTVRRAM